MHNVTSGFDQPQLALGRGGKRATALASGPILAPVLHESWLSVRRVDLQSRFIAGQIPCGLGKGQG